MQLIPKWLADGGLWLNRKYYGDLLRRVYRRTDQEPAWFDHRIDLYYLWPHNLFWLEHGIFPGRYLAKGGTVLDLCCGDGFYSRYFYSPLAAHVDAVDLDPLAIAHAKRWHSAKNIRHYVINVAKERLPSPHYDLIVWFSAIEHLSKEDCALAMRNIKATMRAGSVLIGSTCLVSDAERGKGNWQHQNEFSSLAELQDFLAGDFCQVETFVTVHPTADGGERRTAFFVLKEPK